MAWRLPLLAVVLGPVLSCVSVEPPLAPSPPAVRAEQPSRSPRWPIGKLTKSIVQIKVKLSDSVLAAPGTLATSYSISTGIVVGEGGLVVTSAHSLAAATSQNLYVRPPNGPVLYKARILSKDQDLDIALIKTLAPGLIPAIFSGRAEEHVGQQVMLAGYPTSSSYPEDAGPVFSLGLVTSAKRTLKGHEHRSYLAELVEVQAWVGRGFSGGPLISRDGRVVGMTLIRLNEKNAWGGYAFALPAEVVRRFADRTRSMDLQE